MTLCLRFLYGLVIVCAKCLGSPVPSLFSYAMSTISHESVTWNIVGNNSSFSFLLILDPNLLLLEVNIVVYLEVKAIVL